MKICETCKHWAERLCCNPKVVESIFSPLKWWPDLKLLGVRREANQTCEEWEND